MYKKNNFFFFLTKVKFRLFKVEFGYRVKVVYEEGLSCFIFLIGDNIEVIFLLVWLLLLYRVG